MMTRPIISFNSLHLPTNLYGAFQESSRSCVQEPHPQPLSASGEGSRASARRGEVNPANYFEMHLICTGNSHLYQQNIPVGVYAGRPARRNVDCAIQLKDQCRAAEGRAGLQPIALVENSF